MKAKTRQEIAIEFGISRRTLYRWLKTENISLRSRLVSPEEQLIIYKKIGFPENLVNKKINN
jgi:DNA invertase Pin-like site-specific DNA recombinase